MYNFVGRKGSTNIPYGITVSRRIVRAMGSSVSETGRIEDRRWYYITLVAGAIAISYFDRQTISVAISTIQRTIPISQQQFSYLSTAFLLAYAAMYAGGGRLLDHIGTRRGFLLIML